MEAGDMGNEGDRVVVRFAILAFASGFIGGNGRGDIGFGFGGEVDGRSAWRWWSSWWRWVNDLAVGIAGDRIAVVAKTAPVGVVRKAVLKELGFGGGVVAEGAVFAFTGRKMGMGDATAETATEGTTVTALVFGVGIWIDGKVVE